VIHTGMSSTCWQATCYPASRVLLELLHLNKSE